MKNFRVFLVAALLAIPAITTSTAIIVDGTLDPEYGSPLATQTLATTFGDNNMDGVGSVRAANGSELDAAYGFISNSVMYLFIAGNLEGGTNNVFNKFEIFIDSIAGHGQHTLTNNNNSVDFGGLNRMGGNFGNGTNGLTFDAGFAPDYWMGATAGGSPSNNNVAFYINYAELRDNGGGPGSYMGTSTPGTTNALTGGTNPFGVHATVNNTNILGVLGDGAGCQSNGAPYGPQSVTSGVELSIPLSAISSGSFSGIRVCVLLNGQQHDFISNQLLGPIATNDCIGSLGEPRAVDLSTLPGQHYFTVPLVGCNYAITPTSANQPANGGVGSVAMTVDSICGWAATSQVSWVTITSGASGSGNGTVNYSVATNTTTIGRTGTIIIGGQTFTVNQFGQPLGAIDVNGTVETNHYGCSPLIVQTLGTGYGDSSSADVDAANGSELDAAYSVVENGVLYIVVTGNLENNSNKLNLFFDTGVAGGQSTLTTNYPGVDSGGLNRMGTDGNGATNGTPGLTFDAGFAPNYWMSVGLNGTPITMFANYAQLTPGGSNGYYLGRTAASTNGTLFGGTNPFGIQAAVNNVNFLGVSGDSLYDDPSIYQQGSVMTGVELGIPLAALGNPTGTIRVCAFVSSGSYDNLSNQILGPINDMAGSGNLNDPSAVDFNTLPGQQYFAVGPEMRITSITKASNNINISWLTGAGSNLVYQLQRTSTLSTAVWANVSSSTNAYGSAVTLTDTGAATNSTMFYRVQQSVVCP